MDADAFRVKFWGVRGSVPVSGPSFSRYGGNTACIELRCGPHTLFIDAGSGIRAAAEVLRAEGIDDFDLFFTHCHYDHIIGLPFFKSLYDPAIKLTAWSGHLAGTMSTRQMLASFMTPPWFPVDLDICKANLTCRDFVAGDVLKPREGIVLRTASLNHPGGCIGYRVEFAGRSVAIVSDTEHVDGVLDPAILDLIAGCDLVVYDCTYTEEEMPLRRGFGHSTWQHGVKLCRAAGARRLALFHHDPARKDTALAEIEREAKSAFDGAFAARDRQILNL